MPDRPNRELPLEEPERFAVRRFGERLRYELGQWIRVLPRHLHGGSAMARALAMPRPTCQRVLKTASTSGDGLEVLLRTPGPEGLTKFLEAIREHSQTPGCLAGAERVIEDFSELIAGLATSHSGLNRRIQTVGRDGDGVLCDEDANRLRADAFEANRSLARGSIEMQASYLIIRPLPEDGEWVEAFGIRQYVGIQSRSEGTVLGGLSFVDKGNAESGYLEQRPNPRRSDVIESQQRYAILPEFSSSPVPEFVHRRIGDDELRFIEPPGVDQPTLDVAVAYRWPVPQEHPVSKGDHKLHLYYTPELPTRKAFLHCYLHRTMAKNCLTYGFVHQRTNMWFDDENNPWLDQLDQRLAVEHLEDRLESVGQHKRLRQTDVVRTLFQRANWNQADFVGFRMEVDHPLWACRHTMRFEFDAPQDQ